MNLTIYNRKIFESLSHNLTHVKNDRFKYGDFVLSLRDIMKNFIHRFIDRFADRITHRLPPNYSNEAMMEFYINDWKNTPIDNDEYKLEIYYITLLLLYKHNDYKNKVLLLFIPLNFEFTLFKRIRYEQKRNEEEIERKNKYTT
jgi:hypothetical protein